MTSLLLRRPDLAGLPEPPAGVELATSDDAEGLARLLTAGFEEPWTPDRVRRDLLDEATVQGSYLIRDGDRIIATASARQLPDLYPGAGYVHWVASDPEVRGRGLGFAVIIAVLHRFVADGLAASVLETDDARLVAIRTYLRLGYVPVYPDDNHRARWSAIFRAIFATSRAGSPGPG